jgi:uncharacterized membrane protein
MAWHPPGDRAMPARRSLLLLALVLPALPARAAGAPRQVNHAAGVAQGYKVDIDPEAWQIVEGSLCLNYDRGVQRRWARDIPGHLARADANWPGLADA